MVSRSRAGPIILELADVRRYAERIRRLEARELLASDLQYTVIRDLFALGLHLRSTAVTNPGVHREPHVACGPVEVGGTPAARTAGLD